MEDNPLCKCGHRMLAHKAVGSPYFTIYYACYNSECDCEEFKEGTMHDTPNPGKSDHPTLAVQRTVTYTAFLAGDSAPYKLFEDNPDVHTVTLESDNAVTTYSRIETEEED